MATTSAPTNTVQRKHPLAECERCPLYKEPCAPTDGPPGARVAVVSRSPGYREAQEGRPFSGPSGKILDHLLKLNGYDRKDVLATNVVLCQTPDPPKEAIDACRRRLETEINASSTILACGSEAVGLLIGRGALNNHRGFVHERLNYSNKPQRVVATFNPAIALRDDNLYPDLVRDFKRALNPPPAPTLPEVRYTDDPEEAASWIPDLVDGIRGKTVAVDIESAGLGFSSELHCIGFSTSGSKAVVLGKAVVQHPAFFRSYLRMLLQLPDARYLWHNGKWDTKILRWQGIAARVDEDTLLMSYALDERGGGEGDTRRQHVGRIHSLDYLLMDRFGWPDYEPESVKKFKRTGQIDEDKLPELYTYNGYDTAGTMQLFKELGATVDSSGMAVPYRARLLRGAKAAQTLEETGFPYDVTKAQLLLDREVKPTLQRYRDNLRGLTGRDDYNPNSAPQNSELVYDTWGVSHGIDRGPAKARSVDESVYTELIAGRFVCNDEGLKDHIIEWAEEFRRYKKLEKQRSTYIEGMIPRVINGRIYTDFKVHGTSSGRWSSANPNLQNITRGGKDGIPNTRSLFVASPGRVILQVDYSQAELRTIAALSGDNALLEVYTKKEDLHNVAAANFYGPNFTKEQRANAKNMNFGVAYGQSAATFQEKHDIPEPEAEKFIKWWWEQHQGVSAWTKEVRKTILKQGYLETPLGRRRRFHLITKENRNEIFREGINFLPQSIASDLTIDSLCVILDELEVTACTPLVTVHDSIVFDCLPDAVERSSLLIREIMESRAKELIGWTVPFEVDITTGPDWGSVG